MTWIQSQWNWIPIKSSWKKNSQTCLVLKKEIPNLLDYYINYNTKDRSLPSITEQPLVTKLTSLASGHLFSAAKRLVLNKSALLQLLPVLSKSLPPKGHCNTCSTNGASAKSQHLWCGTPIYWYLWSPRLYMDYLIAIHMLQDWCTWLWDSIIEPMPLAYDTNLHVRQSSWLSFYYKVILNEGSFVFSVIIN